MSLQDVDERDNRGTEAEKDSDILALQHITHSLPVVLTAFKYILESPQLVRRVVYIYIVITAVVAAFLVAYAVVSLKHVAEGETYPYYSSLALYSSGFKLLSTASTLFGYSPTSKKSLVMTAAVMSQSCSSEKTVTRIVTSTSVAMQF